MADELYGATGSHGVAGVLYTLDLTGAILTTVGPLVDLSANAYGLTGMVFTSAGDLYGITSGASPHAPRHLVRVNNLTAEVIDVAAYFPAAAPPHPAIGTMTDLAIDAFDQIYGISATGLWLVDPLSGSCAYQGNVATSQGPSQGGGLAKLPGQLLAIGVWSILIPPNTFDTELQAVDFPYSLGTYTPIGATYPPGGDQVVALAVDSGGNLFGTHSDNSVNPSPTQLITVDPGTGLPGVLGASVDNLDAIAFLAGAVTTVLLWVAPWWPAGFSPPPSRVFRPFALIRSDQINPINVTQLYALNFGQPPSGSVLWVICRSLDDAGRPNVHSPRLSFTVP